MNDTKILVTGGAGFIGSQIVDALTGKHEVTILDNLSMKPTYINKKAKLIEADIRDRETLATIVEDIEVIYHQAAIVGAIQSMSEIHRFTDINTLGTANLLDILANEENTVKKIILASSMTVYGEGAYQCEKCGEVYPPERTTERLELKLWDPPCPNCGNPTKPIPTKEETPLYPRSLYGLTKKNQEELMLLTAKAYGIPTVILRYNAVYGPRQRISSPYTGVGTVFATRIKNTKPPIIFEDGQQTRDFVHVKDVVQANILALQPKANYQTFNVGSSEATTILNLAHLMIKLSGKKMTPIITGKYRIHDTRHFIADISKIKKIGYEPKVRIEEAMTETINWINTQKAEDQFEQAYKEYMKKKLVR